MVIKEYSELKQLVGKPIGLMFFEEINLPIHEVSFIICLMPYICILK